ncbi:hypothetical protein KR222_001648, partial [Zaprionus bogoriensis]
CTNPIKLIKNTMTHMKRKALQWMRNVEKEAYPLSAAPPHRCRDAYLEELLKDYEPSVDSEESETEDSEEDSSEKNTKHSYVPWMSSDMPWKNVGELALTNIMGVSFNDRRQTRFSQRATIKMVRRRTIDPRIQAPDVFNLMKKRYKNIASAMGFGAVLFQLKELRDRLSILSELWHFDFNINDSLHLFSWSIEDYFKRFNMRDQTYIDVTQRDFGDQLECYKFCVDILEIKRLVDALDKDIRMRRNICDSSMLLIRDAEMDIMELLMSTEKEAKEDHYNITIAACSMLRSADPDRVQYRAVQDKICYDDFIFPIEARYRINWAKTVGEKFRMQTDIIYKKSVDELLQLQENTVESSFIWESTNTAYILQIHNLRRRISDLEIAYDETMEHIENEKQSTSNKLQKAVDDLRVYKERIPYFHARIAEV